MDTKSVLKWKGIALGVALLIAAALFLTVRHFFYILDAYYYTAEFHVLFMLNNLKKANMELFVEYFSSIGSSFGAVPSLFLAHLVQNLWAIFTKPILPMVAIVSLGGLPGAAVTFAVMFLIGALLYSLGIFFLGDILAFVRTEKNKAKAFQLQIVQAISGIGLAVPYVPLFVGVGLAAFVRIPFRRMMIVLGFGLAIRMALSVWVSGS